MSALGQRQTSASASPPKADIGTQLGNVRFVPKADIACAPYRQPDVPINEPCRARPMPAQSREWCRHFLSGDWHVCGAWVHGDRSIPEVTHHLHLTSVIPNIGTDDAEGARHPLHFAYCFWLVGNEIYYEARYRCVERTISDRQFLRVTDLQSCTLIDDLVACERDKAI